MTLAQTSEQILHQTINQTDHGTVGTNYIVIRESFSWNISKSDDAMAVLLEPVAASARHMLSSTLFCCVALHRHAAPPIGSSSCSAKRGGLQRRASCGGSACSWTRTAARGEPWDLGLPRGTPGSAQPGRAHRQLHCRLCNRLHPKVVYPIDAICSQSICLRGCISINRLASAWTAATLVARRTGVPQQRKGLLYVCRVHLGGVNCPVKRQSCGSPADIAIQPASHLRICCERLPAPQMWSRSGGPCAASGWGCAGRADPGMPRPSGSWSGHCWGHSPPPGHCWGRPESQESPA